MFVGAVVHLRSVENVVVVSDRLQTIDEAVDREVRPSAVESENGHVSSDAAVHCSDVGLSLEPLLVVVEPTLRRWAQRVAVRHVGETHRVEAFGYPSLGGGDK